MRLGRTFANDSMHRYENHIIGHGDNTDKRGHGCDALEREINDRIMRKTEGRLPFHKPIIHRIQNDLVDNFVGC